MQSSPSHTALRVALRRAAHQVYDARPLIFDDRMAVAILGPHAAELGRTPGMNPALKARPFSISLRAFLVARSRYAEDLLARAFARGIDQYVVLGAGLDTFAHRNPYPGLKVYEVDHPATQQWKRDLLASTRLGEPVCLTFVPVDFETQSLSAQLAVAGLDRARPAFFAWLGVVPYLTLEAFRSTLSYVASCPRGSGIVFDYGQPRHALPPHEQRAHDSIADRVRQAGEPFRLFFTPPEAASELAAFRELEDLGSAEINSLYFADRTDSLRILGSAGRLISAWM